MKEDYCDQGGAADELTQPGAKEPFTRCPLHFYCHKSFLDEYLTTV